MRCLTLAEALQNRGRHIAFLTGTCTAALAEHIRKRGFDLIARPNFPSDDRLSPDTPGYAHWLGSTWEDDADWTRGQLANTRADLLIVDHYAIDSRWETRTGIAANKIIVIDDLADRGHACGLLIDANLGRSGSEYAELVPADALIATGPKYALLRPEFADWRQRSLERRQGSAIHSIMISMGGVDVVNATGHVLRALRNAPLPDDCRIDIILGADAPWRSAVREDMSTMRWATNVWIDVDNISERMAGSDLAIGGAGITAWERCCLGLPSLIVILAENQRPGALALQQAGAGQLVGTLDDIAPRLCDTLQAMSAPGKLASMSAYAANVTDGTGTKRIAELIETLA